MILIIAFCLMLQLCQAELRGHLKPLGSHRTPNKITEELRIVPQPKQFYDDYVTPRRPVVFRGAATHSGAHKRWSVEGLIDNYGDLIVRLEAKHEQSSELPVSDVGFGRSTIRHFASNFQSLNAYIISQVPRPMEADIMIPPCLRCGTFAKTIQEVHLFIVGKGGKTLLHRDPYSNIHCVFNGTKDWILIDDDQEGNLYQSQSSIDEFGGFSEINVDKVDLVAFPKVAQIDYSKVTLNGGDCIFIPGGFWHQVRVHGEYNTAVSIWFSRNFKYLKQDWSDCDQHFQFTPMADVDIIWRFSGGNTTLSQGHMDIHVLRAILLSSADNQERISIERFVRDFVNSNHGHITEQIKKVLVVSDDIINKKDVSGWSEEKLKRVLLVIDPSDPSNSPDVELGIINAEDVSLMLQDLKNAKYPLTEAKFAMKYRELGGSDVISNELYKLLDRDSDDVISSKELANGRESVIDRFLNAPQHEPDTERIWLKHLRSRDEL